MNDEMNPEEAKRVAVVTGASRGVGRATAAALDGEGYATVLVGRSEGALRETAEGLRHPAVVEVADITDADACRGVIERTVERFGRLDVLANVAGWVRLAMIDDITPEDWRQTVDTNLSAAVYLTQAAWGVFRKQGSGWVVNVSSMSSRDPFPGLGAYAAAKVGLNMFTQVTAKEGAIIGVKAVAIVPGAIETPMLRSLFDYEQVPTEAALRPEEVGKLIVDCVTGRRKVSSGEEVVILSE